MTWWTALNCRTQKDIAHFEEHFTAYKVSDGNAAFDLNRTRHSRMRRFLRDLRSRRETGAFLLSTEVSFGMKVYLSHSFGTARVVQSMAECDRNKGRAGKTDMAHVRELRHP